MTADTTSQKPKRVAVIDIGTNTVILLVAAVSADGQIAALHDEARVVRLGEGIHDKPFFLPDAMDRCYAALADFKRKADVLGCERVIAVGTAGFRNAQNASEFITRVQDGLDMTIEVISGQREADLVFAAAKADFPSVSLPLVVLDIGGGSSEFIVEEFGKPVRSVSLPFGSVKLTEKFLKHDPPTQDELTALDDFLCRELAALGGPTRAASFIATAGTATTISALIQNLQSYEPQRVHGSILSCADILGLADALAMEPFVRRQSRPCLEPKRADVIVAGTRILLRACERFGVAACLVSDRGLRYGVLRDHKVA